MQRDDLIEALRASPFRPFRLYVSDGSTYEIRHPEMLMVTRQSVVVGILDNGGNGNSKDAYPEIERSTTVDLLHVTQMEELERRPT
jgi:hypothetical protein